MQWLCTLLLASACASEHTPDEGAVKSNETALAPWPEPTATDPKWPGQDCDQGDRAINELLVEQRAWLHDPDTLGHTTRPDSHTRELAYEGSVEQLEHPLPDGLAKALRVDPTAASAYRAARLRVGDGTFHLVAKTRSLGLRKGMRFVAQTSDRRHQGFYTDYRMRIHSGDETVLHYEHSALPENTRLPDGLHVERERRLCGLDVPAGGDLYSLRFHDREGESVVLRPGQAASLGDYDVYLWVALYPAPGARALNGIDAREALTELMVVRR